MPKAGSGVGKSGAGKTTATGGVSARKPSARTQYLGRTPGKKSKTGRSVIDRMKKEGSIKNGKVLGSDGKWHPMSKCDMGHKTDAVKYWNKTGRKFGPKSPEARKWMLDPKNYELQPASINRSAGAKLGVKYLPPITKLTSLR